MENFIPDREFHVARAARDRYQFDETLFALSGNVIFANFHAARVFAQKINAKRDLARFPEGAVRAGQLNAMGLIDEILHYVVGQYRQQINPLLADEALGWLIEQLGAQAVEAALHKFADVFPALAVYRHDVDLNVYLQGETNGVANRQVVLEELLMLWLANMNPAFAPFLELFDDRDLEKETNYRRVVTGLHDFFDTQPVFGPDHQNLVDMLRSPALAVPHSLPGQLEYILTHWGLLLGKYAYRLLSSLDLIKEEEKAIFTGPGQAAVPVYGLSGLEAETERFTPDREWMPRLVLLAKNAYVWLDQLSKQYQRPITQLDHVPDEELDKLARWGFSGLWLIGLWERSPASQRIKQLCGNPDAVASAYSLFAYDIARDLGGPAALQNLKDRTWQRGIRLASDMVPNHMGIDSQWVMDHPDWFIALPYSPFPTYTFNGPDVSGDERVGLYLEDHYYTRSDAAVVFKRVDRRTDDVQYVYHGNDGTSFPWNDTAQLNYLKPEVREAVVQTILHVARQFSVIRFDAAMTLTKKHYQRLWFPEPGMGGAIPSRAEHGLTRQQIDQLMPVEFWREVVDRAAQEAPDTLLLAEAFWLMEGYFVRTLGMHRVYNSAFMNMLRDEDNAKYRLVMKNTLEFDPEILKRYVNFMNNPDERTAVDQFGKGDKYFGICTLMATLPGLPMFGHGQVEGLAEKYGMEFRRAYWDEQPDPHLVDRHTRLIFPLLHRRALFAEVNDFLLYDFFTPAGHVDENVFAYSNRAGDERSLVVYHNKFASTRGWVRRSVAYAVKAGGDRTLVQRDLGQGLGLRAGEKDYTIFRDYVSGLEYVRPSRELMEQGLYVELEAYTCHVFLDFRESPDSEARPLAQLAAYLNGRGVPSIDEALHEIFLQPVHRPFRELVSAGAFDWIKHFGEDNVQDADAVEEKLIRLFQSARQVAGGEGDAAALARDVWRELKVVLQLTEVAPARLDVPECCADLQLESLRDDMPAWGTLLSWLFVRQLGRAVSAIDFEQRSRSWIDEWLLGRIVAGALQDAGSDEGAARRAVALVRILTTQADGLLREPPGAAAAHHILADWLKDDEVHRFLQINRYQDVLWFNHESFIQLLRWMQMAGVVAILADAGRTAEEAAEAIRECCAVAQTLQQAEAESGYQVELLLEAAEKSTVTAGEVKRPST